MVQEFDGARLGLYTGRGHGELIRERFGVGWAWLSTTGGLAAATIGSLVTEFTGVAGIGELYGLPRSLTLPVAGAALLAVVATGSYRRVERTAIVIGLFELTFCRSLDRASEPRDHGKGCGRPADRQSRIHVLAAAVIGAVFNPWMIFYQQSAIADKKLQLSDQGRPLGYGRRWDRRKFGGVRARAVFSRLLSDQGWTRFGL